MSVSQIIIACCVFSLLLIYFRYFRNKLIKRLGFLLLFVAGLTLVLFPEWSNKLAVLVGIGRGADLVLYIHILLFYIFVFIFYGKLRKLEIQNTEIIRQEAIKNAKQTTSNPSEHES